MTQLSFVRVWRVMDHKQENHLDDNMDESGCLDSSDETEETDASTRRSEEDMMKENTQSEQRNKRDDVACAKVRSQTLPPTTTTSFNDVSTSKHDKSSTLSESIDGVSMTMHGGRKLSFNNDKLSRQTIEDVRKHVLQLKQNSPIGFMIKREAMRLDIRSPRRERSLDSRDSKSSFIPKSMPSTRNASVESTSPPARLMLLHRMNALSSSINSSESRNSAKHQKYFEPVSSRKTSLASQRSDINDAANQTTQSFGKLQDKSLFFAAAAVSDAWSCRPRRKGAFRGEEEMARVHFGLEFKLFLITECSKWWKLSVTAALLIHLASVFFDRSQELVINSVSLSYLVLHNMMVYRHGSSDMGKAVRMSRFICLVLSICQHLLQATMASGPAVILWELLRFVRPFLFIFHFRRLTNTLRMIINVFYIPKVPFMRKEFLMIILLELLCMTSFALLLTRLQHGYSTIQSQDSARIHSTSDALLTVFILITSGENFSELVNAFCPIDDQYPLLSQERSCDLRVIVVVFVFIAGNLFLLLPVWFTLVVLFWKRSHKELVERVRECRRETINEAFLTIALPIDAADGNSTLVANKEDVLSVLQLSSRCIFCSFFELEHNSRANSDFNDRLSVAAAYLGRCCCCRCFNLEMIKHAFCVWIEDNNNETTIDQEHFDANEFLEICLAIMHLMRVGHRIGSVENFSDIEQQRMTDRGIRSRHFSSNNSSMSKLHDETMGRRHGIKSPQRKWNLIKSTLLMAANLQRVKKKSPLDSDGLAAVDDTTLSPSFHVVENSDDVPSRSDTPENNHNHNENISYSKITRQMLMFGTLRNILAFTELSLIICQFDIINQNNRKCLVDSVKLIPYALLVLLLCDRLLRYLFVVCPRAGDEPAAVRLTTDFIRKLSNVSNLSTEAKTKWKAGMPMRFIGLSPFSFGDGIDSTLVLVGVISSSLMIGLNGPCDMSDFLFWSVVVIDIIRLFRIVVVNENLWTFSQPLFRLLFPLSRSMIVCFAFIYAFAVLTSTAFGNMAATTSDLESRMNIGFHTFTGSILSLIQLLAAEQTMDALYVDSSHRTLLWWRVVIISYIVLVSLITINVLVSTVIAELEDLKDAEESYLEWVKLHEQDRIVTPPHPDRDNDKYDNGGYLDASGRGSHLGNLPEFSISNALLRQKLTLTKEGEIQMLKSHNFSINKPLRGYTAAGLT